MKTMQLTNALAAILAGTTSAVNVNIGNVNGNDVAWAGGSNPCNNVFIDKVNSGDFCGTDFTVSGTTYQVRKKLE